MIPISLPPQVHTSQLHGAAIDVPQGVSQSPENPALREAAVAFETVFLTEMLSHAGMGASGGSSLSGGIGDKGFDGGSGEGAFASMLTREWATRLSGQGGIGLSDAIYRSLLAREASNG